MIDYTCECCGKVFEIEEVEAALHPPEHYEHGECADCFNKEVAAGAAQGLEDLRTWEQKQYLAADKQTAEHLWNTEQYEEVCVHIGGMYGLSKEEASVEPADGWKAHAERCMKSIGA